jgi:Asp-tRNA(Asn)/Glu-tRNA(Gln) amidotransferase C subunit
VDRALLGTLCELSRLRLDAAEADAFAEKFSGLLHFVERVQTYQPQSDAPPLTAGEHVELRQDSRRDWPWPAGTKHDYRVPKVIDFEGEG